MIWREIQNQEKHRREGVARQEGSLHPSHCWHTPTVVFDITSRQSVELYNSDKEGKHIEIAVVFNSYFYARHSRQNYRCLKTEDMSKTLLSKFFWEHHEQHQLLTYLSTNVHFSLLESFFISGTPVTRRKPNLILSLTTLKNSECLISQMGSKIIWGPVLGIR